jgi:FkbM family methyltransferase
MALTLTAVCTAIIIVCISISLISESLHLSKYGHEEEVLQLSFQHPEPDSTTTTSALDVVPSKSDDSLEVEETPHVLLSSATLDVQKFRNSVAASPPPSCTQQQLAAIYLRLPEFRNKECQARGWFNKCPISLVTGCPEATWLDEHYQYDVPDNKEDFLAINVGCNKGYDAVNFLRIGSNDPSIARKTWREALPPDTAPGVCGQQQDSTQYQILSSSPSRRINRNAMVYCIEPMPSTFMALQNAANATGWAAQLKVLQLAIDNQEPSTVPFPEASPENLGFEKQAIGKCKEKVHSCVPVETQRLDLMMNNQQLSGKRVHIMLVDVEGFDFEVLKGGNTTLHNTEYVEFEFNWRGQVRVLQDRPHFPQK